MIPRLFIRQARDKLGKFPAVGILGARQCGKTTLARSFGGVYFDMEAKGSETRLDAEWDALTAGPKPVVIDEAHRAPWVFPRLRGAIDADRKRNGRFLLLGSVSPALMENVSESLAGRLGLVMMTPLILPELPAARRDDLWLRGGYPDGGILDPKMFPEWQRDYLDTLASRDLPDWGLPARPQLTLRLMHMLAALHGEPLNASKLGESLSLDHKTVVRYIDFLEGAFLLRRLPPYFANIQKRLVKSPRIYWRDSGLLHALMGVADFGQLYRQPWLGKSWEGFVIEQTLAALSAAGRRGQAFYLRTSDGWELDLVLDLEGELWGVEIKTTSDPSTGEIDRLNRAADLIGAKRRVLVCRVARKIENPSLLVCDPESWIERLAGSA